MRPALHRVALAAILVGNAVAFAGVDPLLRLMTAIIVLFLMVDLREVPPVPAAARWAATLFTLLVILQLLPLPACVRDLVQPGFAALDIAGWRPLSLAPWATLRAASSAVVVAGIVLVSMRMARSRSGLPVVLALVALTCGLLAVLGLASEGGAPDKVLLVRANSGGGDAYGPYVNSNHFAVGIELGLPAALALLSVAVRNLPRTGAVRQQAAVTVLAMAVVSSVSAAAVLRSGSRGGVLFLAAGLAISAPWWISRLRARRWHWLVTGAAVVSVAVTLASTRLQQLSEGLVALLSVEGAGGNTRWDMWVGTWHLFARSPLVGSGLGTYGYVIGLDRPATGTAVLGQAHNDWLEWLATTGVAGAAVLGLAAVAIAFALRPSRVRRLRFELRYPLAAAVAAVTAVALHEIVGFGLQTPLNRYLLAVWIGLVWGMWNRVKASDERVESQVAESVLSDADVDPGADPEKQ